MDIFNVLNMIGGLSLFLYGMSMMGNELSKMAGGKLEIILEKLTSKRIFAVLLGAGVTAVIQSSSATTVMVVGFVNSGIMKLNQAVGIIMGANVGTTITSWMLSLTGIEGSTIWLKMLKPSSFSPILAAIGIILVMSNKEESKKKDVGGILLGFAILMFGMETMSGAVSGLADNTSFTRMMTAFRNPILGMAVGAILTAVIQSSSASVGILQALCSTGAVHYAVALPIIMGQNIGTCVTSIISSVGANRNARRSAMIHLYFNLIGTIIFMVVFYSLNTVIDFVFLDKAANAAGIAVIHSLFNIGATILLFPFADKLVKLAEITIPDGAEEPEAKKDSIIIDERFLDRPAFAMELCRGKVRKMAEYCQKSITLSLEALLEYDKKKVKEVKRLEAVVDKYEDAIGSYLVKVSSKNISKSDSQSMSIILHSISDLERISDHALEIVKSAEEIKDKGLEFKKGQLREMKALCGAVNDICALTVDSFCRNDVEQATHVEPLEEVIDTLCKTIKENHINRLKKGKSTIEMGFILDDVLTGLERVSDHCSNIAVEMITILDDDYNTHEYFESLSSEDRKSFNKEYEELIKQYPISKKEIEQSKDAQ
ncbi:Na/Pi cotransporter family protein [Pseudobutyrivibrio xylanivorans]|uniref:Phosphate:Na+ symporter n=1 Tax=Pseudobutyrivibrio xylanivorans TaxID=185007 RepID=A0A1G5S0I8_PSEXY|nr:Na/Pi cotransporter family protein [Pseudobutyrivibrio xylanivorans]SCZ79231.1 phosphate:Na+ symporter [Pseudobutyrivibrio xylanivorans]